MGLSMDSLYSVTLVANRELQPINKEIIEITQTLCQTNEYKWLSDHEAIDVPCLLASSTDSETNTAQQVHQSIKKALEDYPIDVFFVSLKSRRKSLLIADMDSTIVRSETLDDLAAEAGIGEHIAAITRRAMNGELVFEDALKKRISLLKGLSVSVLEKAWKKTKLNAGAKTLIATMRKHHAYTALVSGGFTFFTERVSALCNFDENIANRFSITDDHLDGSVIPPILGKEAKLFHLERLQKKLNIDRMATITIGDGANDIPMLSRAGLGIAYHPKPVVAKQIPNQIFHSDLRAALFAQGYPASEFVQVKR